MQIRIQPQTLFLKEPRQTQTRFHTAKISLAASARIFRRQKFRGKKTPGNSFWVKNPKNDVVHNKTLLRNNVTYTRVPPPRSIDDLVSFDLGRRRTPLKKSSKTRQKPKSPDVINVYPKKINLSKQNTYHY